MVRFRAVELLSTARPRVAAPRVFPASLSCAVARRPSSRHTARSAGVIGIQGLFSADYAAMLGMSSSVAPSFLCACSRS